MQNSEIPGYFIVQRNENNYNYMLNVRPIKREHKYQLAYIYWRIWLHAMFMQNLFR